MASFGPFCTWCTRFTSPTTWHKTSLKTWKRFTGSSSPCASSPRSGSSHGGTTRRFEAPVSTLRATPRVSSIRIALVAFEARHAEKRKPRQKRAFPHTLIRRSWFGNPNLLFLQDGYDIFCKLFHRHLVCRIRTHCSMRGIRHKRCVRYRLCLRRLCCTFQCSTTGVSWNTRRIGRGSCRTATTK